MVERGENPYERDGEWYFYDERGREYGPYRDCQAALEGLLVYCTLFEKDILERVRERRRGEDVRE